MLERHLLMGFIAWVSTYDGKVMYRAIAAVIQRPITGAVEAPSSVKGLIVARYALYVTRVDVYAFENQL